MGINVDISRQQMKMYDVINLETVARNVTLSFIK